MSLTPIPRRRVVHGESFKLPGNGPGRRPTRDAPPGEMPMSSEARSGDLSTPVPPANGQATTLAEAIPGMVEVWRGSNDATGYALMVDQATNESVLFQFPLQEARRSDPGRALAWPAYMGPRESAEINDAEPVPEGEPRPGPWGNPTGSGYGPATGEREADPSGGPVKRFNGATFTNEAGRNVAAPPAMAVREVTTSEDQWRRATGETHDAADRAFDNRVRRMRTEIRTRSLNDANRRRFGQPTITGDDGPKAA
jgi:hypothetical protein